MAGRCRPGDVLALIDGEVNLIGADLPETCLTLLDRLLAAGGELVTLIVGAGAPPTLADALREHLAQRWPFVERPCTWANSRTTRCWWAWSDRHWTPR